MTFFDAEIIKQGIIKIAALPVHIILSGRTFGLLSRRVCVSLKYKSPRLIGYERWSDNS